LHTYRGDRRIPKVENETISANSVYGIKGNDPIISIPKLLVCEQGAYQKFANLFFSSVLASVNNCLA